MNQPLKVGLTQLDVEPLDIEVRRRRTGEAAARAFDAGAQIVVLPELAVTGYTTDRVRLAEVAEPIDGPTVGLWRTVAARYGGTIVGGLCERDEDALFNTAVGVTADGVVGHYRKLHLFAGEKLAFTPGDLGLPVVAVGGARIGLCICYDLRFPEVTRILALQSAELLCVPTAWVAGFDAERWDAAGLCPQARGAMHEANLNQVFIACSSLVGRSGPFELLGSSILADPWGQLRAGPLSPSEESVFVVAIDLGDAERARTRTNLVTPRADRRTDVYGVCYQGRVL